MDTIGQEKSYAIGHHTFTPKEATNGALRAAYIVDESELNVSATAFQLPSGCLV